MDVFISWSGSKSEAVAIALKDWLPNVLHEIKPWLSKHISAGANWHDGLQNGLKKANFGIICLTHQNLTSPWISYEAGSLSIMDKHVCPLLIDLTIDDIKDSPINHFQSKYASKHDIFRLISDINDQLSEPLDKTRIKNTFKKWWPDLEEKLNELPDDVTICKIDKRSEADKISHQLSVLLKDFICDHQGKIIEYFFLAGEYHKDLKTAFSKRKKNIATIIKKLNNLTRHLDENFANIALHSFAIMQRMYHGRHDIAPRICLKVNHTVDNKTVSALYREKRVTYNSDCQINQNTGFKFIKATGKFFFCPNIPEKAKEKLYVNPRLIQDKVDDYNEAQLKSDLYDEDWIQCWSDGKKDKKRSPQHYKDCYKSTLIIPLTLSNNELDPKFIKKFNMKDVDRTVFGYLCFDHIENNYFDFILDVKTGYIFADILSLYLFVRFMYMDQSKTYNNVMAILKSNDIKI